MPATALHPDLLDPDNFPRLDSCNIPRLPRRARAFKAVVDLVVVALFVLPTPVALLFWVLVAFNWVYFLFNEGGSPLVREVRVGMYGQPFYFFKLRIKTRGGRPTRLGEIFRQKAIDELPQWINIALRDMSLVGFRPVLAEEHAQYLEDTDYQEQHGARPGIFGIGISHVTNSMGYEEKIQDVKLRRAKLDRQYVALWSLRLELKAMWHSFVDFLRGHDPRPTETATAVPAESE